MHVRNLTRNTILCEAAEVADTSAKRRQGLLQHSHLDPGTGLWIVPCEAVHMFGMKFAIDVLFLSKKRQVLKMRPQLGKWGLSLCLRAHSVLELPVGVLAATGTQVGDQLELVR